VLATLPLPLDDREQEALRRSASILRDATASLGV
jgi:hypothetical protein